MTRLFVSRRTFIQFFGAVLLSLTISGAAAERLEKQTNTNQFSFVVAGDMRNFVTSAPPGKRYFDGACEALKKVGPGEFLITPGDFDPPAPVRATLDKYLGTNFLWYPVVGNHEMEKPENVAWLHQWATPEIPHVVRHGPPGAEDTMYSFDFGNSHFVAVDGYYNGSNGASGKAGLSEATLAWLQTDLAATHQPLIWVIGHSPIESVADMDTGRVRHAGESVSTNAVFREKFVQLMKTYPVRAYICGHTHNSSVTKVQGIWQADSGHARGGGDTGSPSTFLKFRIDGKRVSVDVYRAEANGENYKLRKTVELD
jgi:hypothetical protein